MSCKLDMPRCETCEHWARQYIGDGDWGYCSVPVEGGKINSPISGSQRLKKGSLQTAADSCCFKYEKFKRMTTSAKDG